MLFFRAVENNFCNLAHLAISLTHDTAPSQTRTKIVSVGGNVKLQTIT